MRVDVAWKWAAERIEVDPLTGDAVYSRTSRSVSLADRAALDVGRRIAQACGATLRVVTVGGPDAAHALRLGLEAGADEALHVRTADDLPSTSVAQLLADEVRGSRAVVLGAASQDRGSATVPPLVAARLGRPFACGVVEVDEVGDTELTCTRRLDGGWRERLAVGLPALLSVEGSAGSLPRSSLQATLAAGERTIEEVHRTVDRQSAPTLRPTRPRTHVVAAPGGAADPAHARVRSLLGGASGRRGDPVELDPEAAARRILDEVRAWQAAR